MSWPDLANNEINDLFRDCVRAEMKAGPRNQDGAFGVVAAAIGCSPQLVKLRYFDHVVGKPRKKGIRERCWTFLDAISRKERAWADAVAASIERQQLEVELQLTLPLEGGTHAPRSQIVAATSLLLAQGDLEDARRAASDYARARA